MQVSCAWLNKFHAFLPRKQSISLSKQIEPCEIHSAAQFNHQLQNENYVIIAAASTNETNKLSAMPHAFELICKQTFIHL